MPYFWIFGFNAINGTIPGLNPSRLPGDVLDVPHWPRHPDSGDMMADVGDVPHPPTEPLGNISVARFSRETSSNVLEDIHLDVPTPPPGTLRMDPVEIQDRIPPAGTESRKLRVLASGSLRAIHAKDQNVEELLFISSRVFACLADAQDFVASGPGERLFRHCPNCVLYELELNSAEPAPAKKEP